MPMRPSVLIELLKTFRDDAIVRGFKDGLKVKNADGTGEVVLMNDGTTPSSCTEVTVVKSL